MKNLLEIKTSLGRVHLDDKEYEVFAEGAATYDYTSNFLIMKLGGFLQETSATRNIVHPPWMPHPQTDREHVDQDEATDLGREIFRRWCESIKHSSPKPLH